MAMLRFEIVDGAGNGSNPVMARFIDSDQQVAEAVHAVKSIVEQYREAKKKKGSAFYVIWLTGMDELNAVERAKLASCLYEQNVYEDMSRNDIRDFVEHICKWHTPYPIHVISASDKDALLLSNLFLDGLNIQCQHNRLNAFMVKSSTNSWVHLDHYDRPYAFITQ